MDTPVVSDEVVSLDSKNDHPTAYVEHAGQLLFKTLRLDAKNQVQSAFLISFVGQD